MAGRTMFDFNGIEELREVRRFMELARPRRGINDSGPIGIGPAGGSH